MKKDQVVILEKRGVILVSGEDAKDFLQNIITNDINKVSKRNSVFSALLTPQGKYLNEFFIIQNNKGYLLDCSENSTKFAVGGLVFGISNKEVTPPRTAALLPLSKSSASVDPGSLKCTWVSMIPGKITFPDAS